MSHFVAVGRARRPSLSLGPGARGALNLRGFYRLHRQRAGSGTIHCCIVSQTVVFIAKRVLHLLRRDLRGHAGEFLVAQGTPLLSNVLSIYGDSMIWAGCIFSQSATGEVSSAYFRKLAISRGGECKFSQTGPNARLCPYSNTLTVRTCGPQAIDRT